LTAPNVLIAAISTPEPSHHLQKLTVTNATEVKMETYKVQIVVTHSFDVEAANEEEAREEAKEVIWDDHIDGYEITVKIAD
jgi:hypothetical protein